VEKVKGGPKDFYDITVPETGCYFSNGIIHHNTGKSFFDVLHILSLYSKYNGTNFTGIIASSTMKRLRQTLLLDLSAILKAHKIKFEYNKQENELSIGTLKFIIINMELPEDIFGVNSSVSICDEMDVLSPDKSMAAFIKIQERTRKVLPDGREPYIVVSSTANGLKGCYLMYKHFIDKKIPFCIARGSTWENPHFAKSSLKMLESLYNDKEKKAFIDGEFMNLNVGRVYPEFDPKVNVYMDFSIKINDTVYVGCDFNAGYNSNCAIINRGGTIYIAEEFKCLVAGDVARTARKMFPENDIVLIPDASGKEIMRGYLDECEEYDVRIMIPKQNPGIAERILCVNKLFRMKKLWVMQKCEGLIMGLEIRGFDEQTGDPEKRRGENSPDHGLDSLEYSLHYIINNSGGFEDLIELINFQSANRRETKYMSAEGLKRYANYKKQAG
jgi:hypothetical protein